MDWQLWPEQGYGRYGSSLSVYVDFQPSDSGAVRCIGPFGQRTLSRSDVEGAMRDLTLDLEDNYLGDGQFVLWGAYADHPRFEEHKVSVLETTCGHVPAPWLRTQLLGTHSVHLCREWTVLDGEVIHKSGLCFPDIPSSEVDNAMFHPDTAEFAVIKLNELSQQLLGSDHQAVELPLFTWTPVNRTA